MKQTSKSVDAEQQAIKQAVLDYVEGVYELNPAKIERSVHPALVKRGYFIPKNSTDYDIALMTFPELIELAKNYNKDGQIPSDAPKEVVVYDLLDQIATAKLIAWWGIDYMHLAKYNGKWMIMDVFWQTHPHQEDRLYKQ